MSFKSEARHQGPRHKSCMSSFPWDPLRWVDSSAPCHSLGGLHSLQKRCSNLLFRSDLCNSVTIRICSIQKNIKRQRCQTRIGSSHCCHWEKICDPSTCHRSLRAPRTSVLGSAWNQSAPFVQTARSLLRNDMKIIYWSYLSHPLIILIIPKKS